MKPTCDTADVLSLSPCASADEKYQSFLQLVYDDHSQPFDELQSIIARYATLHSTNDDLLHSQLHSSTLAEQHRTLYSAKRKERHNDILQLTNDVAVWSAELERVERIRREVEEGMELEEQQHEAVQRQLIQIVLGTENVHQRCKKELQGIRRHGDVGGLGAGEVVGGEGARGRLEREVEAKLHEIGEYVVDLQDIVESVGGLSVEASRPRGGVVGKGTRDKERERERERGGEESKESVKDKEKESYR